MAAALETIQLEHLPPGYDIHVALFQDVQNAGFLQTQLLEGNTEFEYALVDASIVISRTHALAAVYRAVNDMLENRLRSRNVHSEIVFSLSPNNNISSSFRTFGITPTTTALLAIKVTTPDSPASLTAASIQTHMAANITGEQIPFSDAELEKLTDWAKVKKIYKLNAVGGASKKEAGKAGGKGGGGGAVEAVDKRELEVMVLGSMALRGF